MLVTPCFRIVLEIRTEKHFYFLKKGSDIERELKFFFFKVVEKAMKKRTINGRRLGVMGSSGRNVTINLGIERRQYYRR